MGVSFGLVSLNWKFHKEHFLPKSYLHKLYVYNIYVCVCVCTYVYVHNVCVCSCYGSKDKQAVEHPSPDQQVL